MTTPTVRESRVEVAYAASFLEWFGEEGKRVYGDTIPTYMHDRRILGRGRRIGEHDGTPARGLARHVEQVLDADDHPVERAESGAVPRAPVGRVRGFASRLRIDSQKCPLALARRVVDPGKSMLKSVARQDGHSPPLAP